MIVPKIKKRRSRVEATKDYFFSLGKFIHFYALAESHWHLAFRAIADIPEEVSRALVGNVRGGDLIGSTKRVAKIRKLGEEQLEELEYLSAQFNLISEFRDRLVHRSALPNIKIITSTNYESAKSLEDLEILEFTEYDLMYAAIDLTNIAARLSLFVPELAARVPPYSIDWYFEPWRYKRIQPQTPNRQPKPKRPQSHGHQRRASPK